MEKISGVIPSNARTRTVDVSRSQPVRPGAPSWGRPEGHVTKAEIEDKITLSAVANTDRPVPPQVTYKNPIETSKLRAANEVAQKFFETKNQIAANQNLAKGSGEPLAEEMSDRSLEAILSKVNPVSSKEEIA